MTPDQVETRNKNTWGWMGCSSLTVGATICLSTGSAPMPASFENAVCGPQVPGTKKPSDMSTLADLNPCPLNVCCNIWGQCGITKEFCVKSPSDTGAPGTAKPGSNGCISSCGMDIVNNDKAPSEFMKLGYFEAFNIDRPCLHMLPRHISRDYTHVVSWSFSTAADSFPIFCQGVTAAQRQKFASNVVKFAVENELDGLDFDWEYPGVPDIPGIPPGGKEDGANYLDFLNLVRAVLPKDKTLAIAAPASYWYLRGFPIAEMSKVVDYIVYMTYDLHSYVLMQHVGG